MDDVEVERDLSVAGYGHDMLARSSSVPEESMESEVVAAPGTPAPATEAPQATPRSKSAFILRLPRHFGAKEAVAEAKQQGITITEAYVYKVRAAAKDPASAKPKTQKAVIETKAAIRTKAATGSKAAFVRSLPSNMSYAAAAAKAHDEGIVLSQAHFYGVKSQVSKSTPRAAKGRPARKPVMQAKPAFAGLRLASDDAREQALIDAIRALGTSRSRAVLDVAEKFERVTE